MIVYKFSCSETSHVTSYYDTNLHNGIDFAFDGDEIGQIVTVQILEMTQEQYDAIPELTDF